MRKILSLLCKSASALKLVENAMDDQWSLAYFNSTGVLTLVSAQITLTCFLARSVTQLNRACDKRLSDINHSKHYRMLFCGGKMKDCKHGLFQDVPLTDDAQDSKSNSGGIYCAYLNLKHLFQVLGCARDKEQFLSAVPNLKNH